MKEAVASCHILREERVQGSNLSEEARILLIDAETELCDVIASRLKSEGIASVHANSLAEAWAVLERDSVQAIVSEIRLSDGSGLDILRGLSDRRLDIPVIYLTAYGGVEWAKEAIRNGAFEYYDKPVDLRKLSQVVRKAVRLAGEYPGPERRQYAKLGMVGIGSAARDELTGLASHRFVLERLPHLHTECCKQGIPLTLCLIDIDGFRQFNTREGLSIGDLLLIEVGRRLRRVVRNNDVVGRYGGDEFLLILPGASKKVAEVLANRIRENFEQEPWQMVNKDLKLALCIGIAEVDREETADSLEFLDRTIEAVHHAKLQGPGSVVIWRPQLIRETSLQVDLGEPDTPAPDYESINIMMWRFRELNRRLANVTSESLRLLVAAVEARDPYTKHHSVRVASFARYIALELGLPERQVRVIHSASLLHDIGKIGIPDAILTKPAKLTPQETELIRQHPVIGFNIMEQARFFMAELPLIKHHHEWFSGIGYPDRIMGQDIPLGARVIHIADATEAMLARRSYKDPYGIDHTIRQIREGAGRQFDPMLTEVAIRLMRDGVLERLWRNDAGADDELNLLSSSGS